MNAHIINQSYISNLSESFFPDTCTIQERIGTTRDDIGGVTYSYTDKYSDIKCAIGADDSVEIEQADKTILKSTHRVLLRGYYAGITKTMRAVINSENYDIMLVNYDSQDTITILNLKKWD